MGVYIWNKLPSEYQEVEYIQSSGTQYIDTLWTPSSNYCKVAANMTFLGGVNSNTAVFFGMTSGSTGYSLHKNPNWQINAGSSGNVNIATYSNGNLNIEYTLNNNAYTVVLGGSTYTGSYSGSIVQSTRPMHIFNFNENGSNTWWAYAMIYSFKIYSDASTLVRDFVPCYRIADGVIGLYDLVNNQFYTNSGTGTFIKGNDVNNYYEKELKNAYIGRYVTIEDDFSGTTLNSDIRSTESNGGSISVNNGLILSAGNNSCAVYTKATYQGTENKITAEYKVTSESGSYIECYRGLLYEVGSYQLCEIMQCMSTYSGGSSRIMIRTGSGFSWAYAMSLGRTAAPYTVKIEIDCVNNTYTSRINGTQQYTGSLQYALSNFVGCPYFFVSTNQQNKTTTLNNFKLTVE